MDPAQNVRNKALVYEYMRHPPTRTDLDRYFSADVFWRGPHPIDDLCGVDALWTGYHAPLQNSFGGLRRRIDMLLGGESDGQQWVSSHGYFIGTFEHAWLGIPATGRETFLRYGEFCRVEGEKITQVYLLLDLVEVLLQAGHRVLPPSAGIEGFVPPPRTADGILLERQSEAATDKSFKLVHDMLFRGLNRYDEGDRASMGIRDHWHEDMHWYGPAGIGTTRTIAEFQNWHQMPYLTGFPNRQVTDEPPIYGEGHYVATAGWREVIGTHTGVYLGHPPTGNTIEFRIMDFWRREGDKLIENWVLIDLLDVFRQFGVDLLATVRM